MVVSILALATASSSSVRNLRGTDQALTGRSIPTSQSPDWITLADSPERSLDENNDAGAQEKPSGNKAKEKGNNSGAEEGQDISPVSSSSSSSSVSGSSSSAGDNVKSTSPDDDNFSYVPAKNRDTGSTGTDTTSGESTSSDAQGADSETNTQSAGEGSGMDDKGSVDNNGAISSEGSDPPTAGGSGSGTDEQAASSSSSPVPIPDSTPSPTPESTPSPTPESTPAPTPESTPAPTPESTPAPTPESTPAPTPESTPAPTPESTPAPTPESTPAPTPTPQPTVEPTLAQGDSVPNSFEQQREEQPTPNDPVPQPERESPTPNQGTTGWQDEGDGGGREGEESSQDGGGGSWNGSGYVDDQNVMDDDNGAFGGFNPAPMVGGVFFLVGFLVFWCCFRGDSAPTEPSYKSVPGAESPGTFLNGSRPILGGDDDWDDWDNEDNNNDFSSSLSSSSSSSQRQTEMVPLEKAKPLSIGHTPKLAPVSTTLPTIAPTSKLGSLRVPKSPGMSLRRDADDNDSSGRGYAPPPSRNAGPSSGGGRRSARESTSVQDNEDLFAMMGVAADPKFKRNSSSPFH